MLTLSQTRSAVVTCPHCFADLAEFVIFGYHDNLLAGPGPYPPELGAPYDFEAGYKVGKCPFCEKLYWGLTINMIGEFLVGEFGQDPRWHNLWRNKPTRVTHAFRAESDDCLWEFYRHETDIGVMFEHRFGPWPRYEGSLFAGREFLVKLLPTLRAIFREEEAVNPSVILLDAYR